MRSVGAILTVTSGLTVSALVRLRWGKRARRVRPSSLVMICALVYVAGSVWILWFTLTEAPRTLLWLAIVTAMAALGYAFTARTRAASRDQGR